MSSIIDQLQNYISIPYLLIFMLMSYFVKKHFSGILQDITRFEWKGVYTVLIIATIFAVPFLLWSDEGWEKIILTYTFGTSLHELIFTHIEDWFKKYFEK